LEHSVSDESSGDFTFVPGKVPDEIPNEFSKVSEVGIRVEIGVGVKLEVGAAMGTEGTVSAIAVAMAEAVIVVVMVEEEE